MSDSIIRTVAGGGAIRAFFATTKETVETARQIHNLSPTASAALGRLLTGAAIMGLNIKEENGSVSLQIKGDGDIGGIFAFARPDGTVKGYAENPLADPPRNIVGKLNVSGAIGNGTLTVIKDIGMTEPSVGQIELVSGEIAEDLVAYYAQSEQTPSVVALGVLVNTDYTIKQSGGFIVQLMPFAEDAVISKLEKNIAAIKSVTAMFESGMTISDIMNTVLNGFSVDFSENLPVCYRCDCSAERARRSLISLGKKELEEIINSDGKAELECHFCDKKYIFDKAGLIDLTKSN
ncbi:MAG: Hsp33 family molecular chaperone HslO [Clostridiales bacterium]|jgi:molecular chaperone Hsp33|nr:Hsp33 family molecular chaperone HslO [Clostridiales bacterium]